MSQIGFFSRFISLLFLIGLVAVGGFMAYQAGVAQGMVQAPEIAQAIQGGEAVSAPSYAYLDGLGYPFLNFFGTVCLSILFIFLFFGLVKFIFCSRRWQADGSDVSSNLNQVV